jgi:hypothetical protein
LQPTEFLALKWNPKLENFNGQSQHRFVGEGKHSVLGAGVIASLDINGGIFLKT